MQGRWKEELGGWNHKGSKRKRQTRNQTLKDKAKAIIRTFDDSTKVDETMYRSDGEVAFTYSYGEKEEKVSFIDIYKVSVQSKTDVELCIYNTGDTRLAFEVRGVWYDYYTKSELDKSVSMTLSHVGRESFVDTLPIKPQRTGSWRDFGDDFIYNKPFHRWRFNTLYDDGKRRKIAQSEVNRSNRAKLKAWIHNGDWDTVIPIHYGTKSIARMIS